ncbi:homeobox protein 4-like [Xiphias gladius]|uniref:homeobox protein 4-like n=1 Tax=Xiphias gladius TaxID=8245 RepID=UPI001A99A06F|nr:homeobox protein 4-like [Xiphias gladius]
MSLYPSTFQLNPSLCLHLLCLLLLLTDSSSGASENVPVPADPLTHINTTQGNHGSISENAAKDSPETSSLQSPISDPNNTSWIFSATRDQSSPNSSSSNTHMSVSHKLKDTIAHLIPPNHSAGGNHSSMALPSSQQLVSPDPQPPSPETVTHPPVLPSTITALPTQAAHTGSITSTGTITSTTAKPDIDVYADTVLVTSTTTTTRTTTTPTSTTTRTTTTPTSTTNHNNTNVYNNKNHNNTNVYNNKNHNNTNVYNNNNTDVYNNKNHNNTDVYNNNTNNNTNVYNTNNNNNNIYNNKKC